MPEKPDDLARFLEGERAALRAALPAKLADMRGMWSAGDLSALERIAHSLYGSTGTFGFRDLSAACKSLEQAVEALAASGTGEARASAAEALARVETAVAALAAP